MIDLEAIRARDADIADDDPWLIPSPLKPISMAVIDRRALLAHVDALRAAAGKVACWSCEGEATSPWPVA